MSKGLESQSTNKINIVGKLLEVTFRNGKTSAGKDYESANMIIRVKQTYSGREEISEIPVSMFASKYTNAGTLNSGWTQLQTLKEMKTAQNVGIDQAATIRINSGVLRENNFVSRSGQLINTWQLTTSFIGETNNISETANFTEDIFILDIKPEETRDGDATGRLEVKAGIVQYGGNLDVVTFIAEQPEYVDFIERNWQVNDTVTIQGRVRVTVAEEQKSGLDSSWGEDIPQTVTRTIRELIITKGDNEGKEEEFAYDQNEIRKGFNVRKARIEQMQIDAQNKAKSSTASAAAQTAKTKYSWE